MKKLLAGVLGAGLVLSVAPAMAGEWRLDPRRCPDLREDRYDARENRRDERIDFGRGDRREDRADRREDRWDRGLTICPRTALVYYPSRGERGFWDDDGRGRGWDNDGRGRGGYDDDGRRYDGRGYDGRGYAYGTGRRLPNLKLKFDRRIGMFYMYDHGRKIYIRG
jgi:hypothetical protein